MIEKLKERFENNMSRHEGVSWKEVEDKLKASPSALKAIENMEKTGGEPDCVGKLNGKIVFMDCCKENTEFRVNTCYDKEGMDSRKTAKIDRNAIDLCKEMGIEMLNEEEYLFLQSLGDFDLKTSSWIKTPEEMRKLGGALFGDKRYDRAFIYHNGAQSYYRVRGFRGKVEL